MTQGNQDSFEQQRRKGLVRSLRIVLVLTFIGSGFSILYFLTMGIMLPFMQEMRDSGALQEMLEAMGEPYQMMAEAYDMFLAMPQAYFLVGAVLYVLSLTGAIMMWRLRKNGFHFYTTAQLLLIVNALVFLGRVGVQVGDVMLTVLFVVYYYFALRNIGLLGGGKNDAGDTARIAEEEPAQEDE